ncbi:MAG: cytochrome C oxidase subunit IV family protein [Rudaea sp.]|uniref:cytochrome C oxidase subunit IV family protein n=1 Tax=Rudaea sp. TaxID=2136325 RepID=UPI0039E2E5D2
MKSSVVSVVVVWLVLMASTAVSTWWFSRPILEPTTSTLAVMLIAALKVALVMGYFMGLRHAPWGWRLAGAVWVVAAAGTVIAFYLL